MRPCELCGTVERRRYIAQEDGTEVGTGRRVTAGMLVCWQHEARTDDGRWVPCVESGEPIRLRGLDFQQVTRNQAVLK